MKLIRFGPVGKEKPGAILSDGTRIDVSGFGSDFDESFFSRQGMVELDRWLRANSASASRVGVCSLGAGRIQAASDSSG